MRGAPPSRGCLGCCVVGSPESLARWPFVMPPFALVEGPLLGTGAHWGPSVGAEIPGADSGSRRVGVTGRDVRGSRTSVLGWGVLLLWQG
jgi:hypothetical protein